MTEQNEIQVFSIPSIRMDELNSRFTKLNKRATKLGVSQFSYEIVETRSIDDPRFVNSMSYGNGIGQLPIPKIEMNDIVIHGQGPKIEGWKFIGTLDHITFPGDVVVKTVPDEHIDKHYYTADATCDHCGHHRARNNTYILENLDTHETKQIGSSCVKDFIGHDPKRIASLLESFWSFADEISDESWGLGGGYREPEFDADDILALTIRIIKKSGWVSKSSADEHTTPTSSDVIYYLNPPKEAKAIASWKDFVIEVDNFADVDAEKKEIANAREWLAEQNSDNEYIHNLQLLAKQSVIPNKMFGYWCSMIASYQKAMEKLISAKKLKKVNEYVGEVKKRQDFTVRVMFKTGFESYYGWVQIVNMLDSDGHTLVWFANGGTDLSTGNYYKIAGTVKKFDVYKDWKQTHLSRVKIKEQIDTEEFMS